MEIRHHRLGDNIWFHANSVASYLEYQDCRKAVYTSVDSCDKICYEDLISQVRATDPDLGNLQPETIFINQDGVFNLTMRSKMPLAKQFRKWLIREVIPSIMDTGAYMSPAMTQQQLVDLQTKLQTIQTEKEAVEAEKQQLQLTLQAETQIRHSAINRNMTHNSLPLDEVYILTTRRYECHYIYKIGNSNNTPRHLKSLNSARIKDEDLFICYIAKCYDAYHAEKHIHILLDRYRYQNNREFFVMHFDDIRALIDTVCQDFLKQYEKSVQIHVNTQNRECPEINPRVSTPFVVLTGDERSSNSTNVITRYYTTQK
jgi:prophage antirepressor-like protein